MSPMRRANTGTQVKPASFGGDGPSLVKQRATDASSSPKLPAGKIAGRLIVSFILFRAHVYVYVWACGIMYDVYVCMCR
jgi:hypothetical protein